MPMIFQSEAYIARSQLILSNYQRLFSKSLIPAGSPAEQAESLYYAPFVLLSHGVEDDPIFNFANQTALKLFELSWEQLKQLPSRKSAEPVNRDERQRLLEQVTEKGYIDHYSGVRVSSTGRRFQIHDALVWNLSDSQGEYQGQAAMFDKWEFL